MNNKPALLIVLSNSIVRQGRLSDTPEGGVEEEIVDGSSKSNKAGIKPISEYDSNNNNGGNNSNDDEYTYLWQQ